MLKRLTDLCLCACLLVALTSCGGGNDSDNDPDEIKPHDTRKQGSATEGAIVDEPKSQAAAPTSYQVSLLVPESFLSAHADTLRWGGDQALVHVTPNDDCFGLMGSLQMAFSLVDRPSGIEQSLTLPLDPRRGMESVALAWHVLPNGEARALGLSDPQHTSTQSRRFSQILGVSDQGKAFGVSWRYPEGSERARGTTAWVYDGQTTHKAGLEGELYTDLTTPVAMNDRGDLIGFTKTKKSGDAAWICRDGKTTRIGLLGKTYTRYNDEQVSRPTAINNLGHVVGWAENYQHSHPDQDGWYFDGEHTVRLMNPLANDVKSNQFRPIAVNDAGHVVVMAGKKTHSTPTPVILVKGSQGELLGSASGSVTQDYDVRPSGSGHQTLFLAENNVLVGVSRGSGGSVFAHNGEASGSFTRMDFPNPYRGGVPLTISQMLDNGVAIGPVRKEVLKKYQGWENGECAWVWDGTRVHPIALPDDETTTFRGANASVPVVVNQKAMVAGVTFSIDGFDRSQSAWLYDGKAVRRLGYTDDAHTITKTHVDIDGGGEKTELRWQDSSVLHINHQGQVVGRSTRPMEDKSGFDRDRNRPWTTWLYDPQTDMTHELFGASKQTNYPGGRATHLADNGTVLGWVDAGSRGGGTGFVWMIGSGLTKLDPAFIPNMQTQGWASLHKPFKLLKDQTIIGYGSLTKQRRGELNVGYETLFRLAKPSN